VFEALHQMEGSREDWREHGGMLTLPRPELPEMRAVSSHKARAARDGLHDDAEVGTVSMAGA